MKSRCIGFIGIGVMGSAMARHLAAAGHMLTLYDLDSPTTRKAARRIAGASIARSPKEVGEKSDIVITMLPNGEAVRACVEADVGLAAGMKRGTLLIDCSSAEPWLTRATAQILAIRGIDMIDAPVSGAQEGAETATLVFMCGGSDGALKRAKPILKLMGKHIFHLGPVGAGHTMKTVNNLATALTCLGTAEAMIIGKAHGLEPSAMIDVLNVSTGQSFVTTRKYGPQVVGRRFDDAFKLSLMRKDVTIALSLADDSRLDLPASKLGKKLWSDADAAMGEGSSVMDIARWYELETGIELADAKPKLRNPRKA